MRILVLLPVLLIAFAVLAAGGMAYGADPRVAQFPHGVGLIMLARRLEWPLITVSLILCLVLLALVISGKRRAWWLIGLAPVLALFLHRFSTGSQNYFIVAENPIMVGADEAASFLHAEDYVVGITFHDEAYAYPYAALYETPVIVQQDRERRLILLWSPFANCARAFVIDREVRARELDIVSMPANSLLVYNARLGEFIIGVTGKTHRGTAPSGFHAAIPTQKLPWKQWLAKNPTTRVMTPIRAIAPGIPRVPIRPTYPMPQVARSALDPAPETRVAMVPATQPIAIADDAIKPTDPLNLMAGPLPLLLFRDPFTGQVCAFERRLDEDLTPRFKFNKDRRRKDVVLVDSDTNTGWSAAGIAIDGDKKHKGAKLKPVEIEDEVYWSVMKFWLPDLQLLRPRQD